MTDKPKRKWYQFHLSTAIGLMLVSGSILVPLLTTIWWTIFTHEDNKDVPIFGKIVLGLVFTVIWSSVILAPVLIIANWVEERKWWKVFAASGAIVGCLWVIAYSRGSLPIPYPIHAVIFRERVRWTVDFAAIQKWQSTIQIQPVDNGYVEVPTETWPQCIKDLGPDSVCLMPNGEALQIVVGGSGFGHWGLIVAPSGKKTPPPTKYDYRFPLKNGIDVFEAE